MAACGGHRRQGWMGIGGRGAAGRCSHRYSGHAQLCL